MTYPHEDEQVLHVQLELVLGRRPVIGTLRSEGGANERFVGWLGFVGALERLSRSGTDASGRSRGQVAAPQRRPTKAGHPAGKMA